MKLVDRIGKAEGAFAFWDRLLRWMPAILGTTLSGTVSGWAAATTKVLEGYAPLSWVLAVVFGACSFLTALLLWQRMRLIVTKIEFTKRFSKLPSTINPLESTFTKQRIALQDFRTQFMEPVVGKTFVDCEIYGPAIVILAGKISMSGATFGNCDFIKIKEGSSVQNGIPFLDLTVTRGKMMGLTFLVPEGAASKLNEGVRGVQWITN